MNKECWTRLLMIVAMILAFMGMFYVAIVSDIHWHDNQYSAWVKMTGNPAKLTRDEWESCTQKMLETSLTKGTP